MRFILATVAALASPAAFAATPADTFKAVCDSAFVKSEKLQAACAAGDMPRVVKAGNRFDARGIGAEVNTLAANLHLIRNN